MSGLSAETLHRLLAAAAGISPTRLDSALHGVGADPRWSQRAADRLARVLRGESPAKVAAEITFRDRPFLSDARACLIRDYLSTFVDAILQDWRGKKPRILEVGCGAGAVIISLALEMEGEFWGVDIDPRAVELARENAATLGAPVTLLPGDLLTGLPSTFEVLFANVPYESAATPLPEARWEPEVALYDPGGEGFGIMRRLLAQLPETLEALYLEVPEDGRRQRWFAGTPIHTPEGEQVGVRMTREQALETRWRLEAMADELEARRTR